MSLKVIGLSHKTAPIDLREKLAFGSPELEDILSRARQEAAVENAVVLSTCNRTEIYTHGGDAAKAEWGKDLLRSKFSVSGLDEYLYVKEGEAMVRHLFSVASGLDSLVYGEQEIQKQVKDAYLAAHSFGLTSKLFNVLFQRALYVGKLVRTHTGIGYGALSVGSVAVSLAEKIFGDLRESTVLIFGAGKMAEVAGRHLLNKKIKRFLVANRTPENAAKLAGEFRGEPLTLEEGLFQIASADILIASMASERPILTQKSLKEAMARRGNRSLFVIDIAVPRNVEPSAHSLDNLYLYNIDDLEGIARENLKSRGGEIEKARTIVEAKAGEFWEWARSLEAGEEKSLKHAPRHLPDFLAEP